MLTQSDSGAVVSAQQQRPGRMHYLATETKVFGNMPSIRFVLESLKVHNDTPRYLGMFRITSYDEKKNALCRPERLFKNVMFRKRNIFQVFKIDSNTYFNFLFHFRAFSDAQKIIIIGLQK